MTTLNIPKKHYDGFIKFFSLPDEVFQQLITNLHERPFSLDLSQTLRGTITSTEGIAAEDSSSIADALISLCNARGISDQPTDEFINSVVDAAARSSSEALVQFSNEREGIASRLQQLLEVSPVGLATKARHAMFDYDNVFSTTHVSTDIRPVFKDNERDIEASIIIHNLRIHYHRDTEHKDFFVAMDSGDVQQLIDSLQRAQVKAESIKSILEAAKVPYIDIEKR